MRARALRGKAAPLLWSRLHCASRPDRSLHRHRLVDKLDLTLIEHLLRRGAKQLEMATSGSVSAIHRS